jgi:ketosteroid isomerase-like protein
MPTRLVATALILFTIGGAARADDADEIRKLDKEVCVATWTNDALWFEKNVDDDYVLITPSGATRTKSDVIREISTPGLNMEPYEPTDVDVRLFGDTAVVTGRMLQRFTMRRIRYANDLRYTDVYVKRHGRWMLVSGHTSNVAAGRGE